MNNQEKALYSFLSGDLNLTPTDIYQHLPRHLTKFNNTRTHNMIDLVVVHCTDRDWSIEELAIYDIGPNHISSTGCASITYHDVIMPDGHIFHTLPYNEISWHAGGYNKRSIAVSLMYVATNPLTNIADLRPTKSSIKALRCHCGNICLKFGLLPESVVGHRELQGTGWFWRKGHKKLRKSCPGLAVDMDQIRYNIAKYMQLFLKENGYYNGNIDGWFHDESKLALKLYKESI